MVICFYKGSEGYLFVGGVSTREGLYHSESSVRIQKIDGQGAPPAKP